MDRRKMPKSLVILLMAGVISAVAICFSYWVMESEPVSRSAAEKIATGMTKVAVESIIGKPRIIHKDAEREQWVYGHALQWQCFAVYFTDNGTVVGTEYDR